MQSLHVLSLTLLSVLAVNALSFRAGGCLKPAVQANFDPTRYVGRWYEIQKLPAPYQLGECTQATYTLSDGIVLVLNEELLADGTINSIEGTAQIVDASEPAKLEVLFPGSPPAPYWVLATDYDNYSLVYGCADFGVFHLDFAWILSRSRTLPKETISELQGILKSSGVNVEKLTVTDQRPELCSGMP
ncbi:apolipoprotein D-like [Xyrauchen texanus]|uniref:apolipoprotein D-like n=1 Tax=Xyrauchen texanus TaxID=154827 RepID=UPI0022422949|nr:apolipoprotein D-like [Xyrauchen texanus]